MAETQEGTSSRTPSAVFMPDVQAAQFSGGTFSNVGRDNITVHNHNHHPSASPGPTTELDIAGLLEALPLPNFWKLQLDIFGKVTEGTGRWLADGQLLRVWMEKGKILWAIGIPGAGKTYLASIVINELTKQVETSNGKMCLAYVYFRYSEPLSVQQILQSLVRQIVQRYPHVVEILRPTYTKHHRDCTQPTAQELCSLLASLSQTFEVCIFAIDGVDEMPPEDQRVLVRILASVDAKLFLTSRPLPGLQRNFPDAVVVDVMAQDRDLELHLKEYIRRTPGLDDLFYEDRSFEQEVVGIIKDRCGGMFLHADLQLQALRQALSVQDAREILDQFPERIEDIYLCTWERIEAQPPKYAALARMVLLWVINAQREMSIHELRRAVAASLNPKDQLFETARMVPESTITTVCCGLVTVNERTRTVRLIHYTAKDTLAPLLLALFPQPQALLLSVCITHLIKCGFQKAAFASAEELEAALAQDPLLNYAYYSWGRHAHASNHVKSSNLQVINFVLQCEAYPVCWSSRYDAFGPPHLAAYLGLCNVMESLGDQWDPNATTAMRATPLFVAAKRGQGEIIRQLLAHPKIDVNALSYDGDTALVGACAEGHEISAKLLLEHPGIDVNIPAEDGTTAIINAGGRGYEALVKLLFAHPETDINWAKGDGCTALIFAAWNGHLSVVKLLLARPEIRPNMMTQDEVNALMFASIHGHADVVEALLGHPSTDPNISTSQGLTALIFAAVECRASVLKALLRHPKIAVNMASHDGCTALFYAASQSQTSEMVEHLLGHPDIDVNLANEQGVTPLISAVSDDARANVEVLLRHPATDVNRVAKNGDTALGLAASIGLIHLVRRLLEHPKTDVNIGQQGNGKPPLELACEGGHEEATRLLLRHPDIDIKGLLALVGRR